LIVFEHCSGLLISQVGQTVQNVFFATIFFTILHSLVFKQKKCATQGGALYLRNFISKDYLPDHFSSPQNHQMGP
jgi:hypothetical protein